VELKKGDYWIKDGKKNNNIAFLEGGYLRKFYFADSNEITDFFYFENDLCADLPSLISNTIPHVNIIAMQNTRLIVFSYHAFIDLCEQSPTIEHLYRIILEYTFLRFYNRTTSFILQTPKERYNNLIISNPLILQRATQYHIASYLGISPQHLSRLRGE
jgi:CRP-like cAMP-binding protein